MKGRILVVDGNYDTLVALATALRARNHHVALATDGRSGLQHAVETSAEVVLVDRDLPVLDVRTFLEVLRDNPRTSDAHVFIMGEGDPARLSAIDALAEPIVKPFNAEEIARRVHEVIQRRRAPRGADDLKGDLSQVALFDLLQVFSQNRRTGKLEVHTPSGVGAIWLAEGRITDAVFGQAIGEKAVYRVLALREGRFLFQPEARSPTQRISLAVDYLLMEAVRRVDESVRVRSELPPLTARSGRPGGGRHPRAPRRAAQHRRAAGPGSGSRPRDAARHPRAPAGRRHRDRRVAGAGGVLRRARSGRHAGRRHPLAPRGW